MHRRGGEVAQMEDERKNETKNGMYLAIDGVELLAVLKWAALVIAIVVSCSVIDFEYKKSTNAEKSTAAAVEKSTSKAHTARKAAHRRQKASLANVNNLDDIMKSDDKIVDALESASAEEDEELVRSIVAKIQSCSRWEKTFSEDVQSAAVDAIESFSASMASELAGFLASPYEDVVDDTLDAFSSMLEEIDDDSKKAELIVTLSKAVEDSSFIEDVLIEIDILDPKAKRVAVVGILKNGTEKFKSMLREDIDSLTDDEVKPEADDVKLIEQFEKWSDREIAEDEDDE